MRCGIFGLCLVSLLLASTGVGAADAPESVVHVEYLLDTLSADTITVHDKKAARAELRDSRCFQPFHHSGVPDKWKKYHRRAIFHYKQEVLRDMREVLVVPAASTASFSIGDRVDKTLLFTPFAVMKKRKEGAVLATVSCLDEQGRQLLWQQRVPAGQQGKLRQWPADVTVAVPASCTGLSLEAGLEAVPGVQSSADEVWMVWGSPRLERRVEAEKMPPYNVLFIVVDALRSDVVGVHREGFDTVSEAMDDLERHGTTFPNGFSNGNTTLLSMNTMLLGGHARALGFLTLWWAGRDRRPLFYERKPPYLPLQLHRAGYVTFGATHNHLYFPGYRFAVDPGFDVLQDSGKDTTDHPLLTRRAVEFMTQHKNHRFLAQVNLIAPHQPYTPPPECRDRAVAALKGKPRFYDPNYIGEVCWADRHVGLLVKALEDLDLAKDTLIVLTADHGEVMDRAHDCFSAQDGSRCRFLHGLTLYNEELNVPIVFSLPGVIKQGQAPAFVAQHVDIVPTILDLLKLPIDPRMTGRSLTPSLLRGETMEDVPVYAERWLARAFRLGRYKLIEHTRKDDICPNVAKKVCKSTGWRELYDIQNDPEERHEISAKHPDIVKDYRKRIQQLKQRFHEQSGSMDPNP